MTEVEIKFKHEWLTLEILVFPAEILAGPWEVKVCSEDHTEIWDSAETLEDGVLFGLREAKRFCEVVGDVMMGF